MLCPKCGSTNTGIQSMGGLGVLHCYDCNYSWGHRGRIGEWWASRKLRKQREYTERQVLSRLALFLLFWLVLGVGFVLGMVFEGVR